MTGGAGFIGSHIVERLIEVGHEVSVIDNLRTGKLSNLDLKNVSFYNCDVVNKVAVFNTINNIKPDFIIHQAAQVSVAESIKDMVNDQEINIAGSLNIIEAAKSANVKKIVFASSAAVYGNPKFLPISCEHPINPTSPYGVSKYTVEQYLKVSKKLYGLDYTILRYSNVYGPRQDSKGEGGVVAIFSDKLANQESPFIFGDGMQTRDFIFVEDVAKANVAALTAPSGVYNVSSGHNVTVNHLYEMIVTSLGKTVEPIYKEEREGDIRHSVLDNTITQKKLNWKPQYLLEDGLNLTLRFYMENLANI